MINFDVWRNRKILYRMELKEPINHEELHEGLGWAQLMMLSQIDREKIVKNKQEAVMGEGLPYDSLFSAPVREAVGE